MGYKQGNIERKGGGHRWKEKQGWMKKRKEKTVFLRDFSFKNTPY